MSATLRVDSRPTLRALHRPALFVCLAAAPLAVLAGTNPFLARGLLGAAAAVCLVVVALRDRVLVVVTMVGWLALLGFLRRLLIPFAGWSAEDPLLLLGPVAAVVLLVAGRDHAPQHRTALTSFAVFQLLWITAQVTNPNEPSLLVAAQGALFFVAPLLWFFVGRSLPLDAHDRIHRAVLWVAIPVVALGYWHTLVGLLPFELTWLGVADVPASLIFVRGFHIRPFSTLASPQEYGVVLSFVSLLLIVRLLHEPARRRLLLAALSVTVVALFLQGSRGIFLTFAVAAAVVVAIHRRSVVGPLLALTCVGVLVVVGGFGGDISAGTPEASPQPESSAVDALVRHQVEGLSDPSNTTLGLHVELAIRGVEVGLRNPLGLGPSNNRIQDHHDPTVQSSPETEFAITISALGIPGAIALVGIYISGFAAAFRLHRRHPSARHLAWLALLIAAGDQAFNGRLYLASTLVALSYGGIAASWAAVRGGNREVVDG